MQRPLAQRRSSNRLNIESRFPSMLLDFSVRNLGPFKDSASISARAGSPDEHPENVLETLRTRVNKQIGWLQRKFPKAKDTYLKLRKTLQEELGIRPSDTYLYIQGHALMDGVVLPLLTPVCSILRREREKEISELALHGQQKQNELSGYRHSQSPIDLMLRKGTAFKQSAPYQHLRADIERLTERVLQKEEQSNNPPV